MATLKASQTTYAEMLIIISVCICLDYEPWNHIPLIIEGSTCDNSVSARVTLCA